jgi:hypothetical protein
MTQNIVFPAVLSPYRSLDAGLYETTESGWLIDG